MPSQTHRTGAAPVSPQEDPGHAGARPHHRRGAPVCPRRGPRARGLAARCSITQGWWSARGVLQEPVGERLGGGAAVGGVDPGGGEQLVGIPATRPVLLGAAVLEPVADHRVGGLRVELRADGAAAGDQLRPAGRRRQDVAARRWREHVVVPLHPRPGGDGRRAGRERRFVPADLGTLRPTDTAAERVRQHLGPEADGQERDLSGDDRADVGRLGFHEVRRLGPVDVPLRPEREHEVDAGEVGPVPRLLAVSLGEPEPTRAQVVPDEPAVERSPVPDHHRPHPPECSMQPQ